MDTNTSPEMPVAPPAPVEKHADRRQRLRSIRDGFVDLIVCAARVGFFWVPGGDPAYGKALMVFHPILLVSMILMFFLAPARSPLRIYIAFFFLFVSFTQWLFSGCVITRAEQRLTGSKETIIDQFLTLAGVEITRDSRNAATIASGTLACCMLLWATFCDFFLGVRTSVV
jgi:hypothetical protein